jgi:hypothetical protein
MNDFNGQHLVVEELSVDNTTLQDAFWTLLKIISTKRG